MTLGIVVLVVAVVSFKQVVFLVVFKDNDISSSYLDYRTSSTCSSWNDLGNSSISSSCCVFETSSF